MLNIIKCRKFFKRIKKTPAAPYKNFFWPTIPQRQDHHEDEKEKKI